MIYEGWQDQSAYEANEKAVISLRDKLKLIAGAPYDTSTCSRPASSRRWRLPKPWRRSRKGRGNLRYDVVKSVKPPQSHTTLGH